MLYKAKFAVCPEISTKYTNPVSVQNLKFLVVQPGGTGSMIRFKSERRIRLTAHLLSLQGFAAFVFFFKLVRKIAKSDY